MAFFSVEKASNRKVHTITLDSMDGDQARIIELTGDQAYEYQLSMVDKSGQPDFQKMRQAAPKLIAMSVVDENDDPVMDVKKAAALRQKVSDELVRKINEVNKIDQPEEKKDSAQDS